MSPLLSPCPVVTRGFPRVSGDEPEDVRVIPTALLFSPRERG